MKTPVSYYGGKQRMLPFILPRIPPHALYTEAFFGGGAVLFAKQPARVEVINDRNDFVINFYQVLQDEFDSLVKLINVTLHSRSQYRQAYQIYKQPQQFSPVTKAWAFWVLTQQGFAHAIGSWGYDNGNSVAHKLAKAKWLFHESLKKRVESLQIECNDGAVVIQRRDCPEAFHYVDPPYVGSDCQHYAGYNAADFDHLLSVLSQVQGKFLLSSYEHPVLATWTQRQGWATCRFRRGLSVTGKAGRGRTKVELLTANYPIGQVSHSANDSNLNHLGRLHQLSMILF